MHHRMLVMHYIRCCGKWVGLGNSKTNIDLTHGPVVAGVLHCVWSELPTEGVPWSIVYRLVATQLS